MILLEGFVARNMDNCSAVFNGVSGPVKFDESGTRLAASERHIFKNGQFIKLEE